MRLTEIGENKEAAFRDIEQAIKDYEERDKARAKIWLRHFSNGTVPDI